MLTAEQLAKTTKDPRLEKFRKGQRVLLEFLVDNATVIKTSNEHKVKVNYHTRDDVYFPDPDPMYFTTHMTLEKFNKVIQVSNNSPRTPEEPFTPMKKLTETDLKKTYETSKEIPIPKDSPLVFASKVQKD